MMNLKETFYIIARITANPFSVKLSEGRTLTYTLIQASYPYNLDIY